MLGTMMKDIAESKRKAKLLLCEMMPREVAVKLLNSGQTEWTDQMVGSVCESFDSVTIAFIKVWFVCLHRYITF
jgi:hypothetical protein